MRERRMSQSERSGKTGKKFGARQTQKGEYQTTKQYKANKPAGDNRYIDMRDAENQIEGRNPVREALRSGRTIERILVANDERRGPLGQIITLARDKGIRVEEVDRRVIDKRSVTGAHQGVLAMVAARSYVDVVTMLEMAKQKAESPLLLLCDGLQDPHNLGSVLRSVDAAGGHGVVIPARRSVGLTATVAKTSAGAVEYVPVARVSNLAQEIAALKEAGIWVVGAHMEGGKPPWEIDMTGPIALVVGSEGEGLSRLVAERCDYLASIPMAGRLNSLNASVAAALMLFEAARQRHLAALQV